MEAYSHAQTNIKWKAGLHIRPATYIVKMLQKYECDVKLIKNPDECNAKSVIQMISLGAECGTTLIIEVRGKESHKAVDELKIFFAKYEDAEEVLW